MRRFHAFMDDVVMVLNVVFIFVGIAMGLHAIGVL